MATEEVEFLRDQVQRLNAVLAQYQEKYPLAVVGEENGTRTRDTPWLTDRSLMSPLLTEYDTNITLLREQLEKCQTEQHELRVHADKLVAENKRLTKELKDAVEVQLNRYDPEGLAGGATTGDDARPLHNLQDQLQMALAEKDSAMEMWQASVLEVERLEQELRSQQYHPRLQSLESQAGHIKQQYMNTVADLNTEITSLQEQLRRSKTEHKASSIQVTELRKTLEEMRKQLYIQEQEKMKTFGDRDLADHKASSLAKKSSSLENRIEELENLVISLKREKAYLEERVLELTKKCSDHEQREYEAALQVRDSVQMVENAMLEKDQAMVRERQAVEESQKMQDQISNLMDEAGVRTRQEVDNVRKQCNDNIGRLMEEIHSLELGNSGKQAQLDRAVREKRAVESELEKIYHEGMAQGNKESNAYDELNRRACNAERLRDEAKVKLDQSDQEMRRLEMTLRQEKSHLKSEIEQLKDRYTQLSTAFDSANEDRVKLVEQVDELKRKGQKMQQERDSAHRNLTKDRTCLEHDLQLKEKEFEAKLQTTEDSHRHASMELRQLLTAQQRMSAKWKEECSVISRKYEAKTTDLRADLSRQKTRNEELTKLLKDSRDKTIEVEQMMSEYTQNIKRLEERVRESEYRAANSTTQVSKQMKRDRNIIEERNYLKRQLERSLQETKNLTAPDYL